MTTRIIDEEKDAVEQGGEHYIDIDGMYALIIDNEPKEEKPMEDL
jgi:hypothetical protein